MDLEKLCFDVQGLAKIAGLFISEEREKFNIEDIIVKGKADFVSYVDKQAEVQIVNGLRELLPGSGFIAEEGTAKSSDEKYKWIIDPLDGTTNFIHGLPPFAVSIALMDEQELVLGVVYEVTQDECFYAWKGSKAYLNGEEIKVSTAASTSDALIATGFPYSAFEKLESYIESMRYFMVHSHGLRRLGSAATDMCYVAAGRFEAFYEHGLKPWDVAAGTIILQQAGGKVADFNGGDKFLFNGEMVAANGAYFNEFYNIVHKYFVGSQV
ncbi:MAG: inositol monophosphatase [Mariniphaga sp.]|nr:inositol monophosphatase [Mariniphaga sp.]